MRGALPVLLLVSNGLGATVEVVGPSKLVEPFGVAFDAKGNWYICEHKGERITRVPPAGNSDTLAGTGTAGFSGDNGPAGQAQFRDPHGLVITRNGVMYVADTLNHRIRKVDLRTGTITTIAGTGEPGYSGDGGPAVQAQFNGTFAIDLDEQRNRLYVADLNSRRVRAIDLKSGVVSTLAGNGSSEVPVDDSEASKSPLVDPRAVAADRKGNVYILERRGNALRVVNSDGKIRTLIGPGTVQPDLNGPKHLTVDRKGDVLIADAENHLVRRYSVKDKKLVTIAGTGVKGDRIDAADPVKTELNRPHGVYVHPSGDLYVSDSYNHRIVRIQNR